MATKSRTRTTTRKTTKTTIPEAEHTLPTPEEEMRDERRERIAARAYERYEARGGDHGQDFDDWLEAERDVDAEIDQPERRED